MDLKPLSPLEMLDEMYDDFVECEKKLWEQLEFLSFYLQGERLTPKVQPKSNDGYDNPSAITISSNTDYGIRIIGSNAPSIMRLKGMLIKCSCITRGLIS